MKIGCRDECGASIDDEDPMMGAWRYLEGSKKYRCPACAAALAAAQLLVGTSAETVDELPSDSRGALQKETASTILPPSATIPR